MTNEVRQDHFSGPFCVGCDDAPETDGALECDCAEARCIVPRCHLRVAVEESAHGWPPVPVAMLQWQAKGGSLASKMLVSPGWACSPFCLFEFVRSTRGVKSHAKASGLAVDALNALHEIYFGIVPTSVYAPRLDERIWKIAASDQVGTIREAVRIANHELISG